MDVDVDVDVTVTADKETRAKTNHGPWCRRRHMSEHESEIVWAAFPPPVKAAC